MTTDLELEQDPDFDYSPRHALEAADKLLPLNRTIRTGVQVFVGQVLSFVVLVGFAAAVAPDVLHAIEGLLPPSWKAWAVGAVGTLTAVSMALTRLMAIPAVNAVLTQLHLGVTPKR